MAQTSSADRRRYWHGVIDYVLNRWNASSTTP